MKLLGTVVSFDEYRQFYDKHFAPQKIKSELPTEYAPEDELPKQIYEDELPDQQVYIVPGQPPNGNQRR